MPTPGISAPSDGRVAILDSWLESNRNTDARVDLHRLEPRAAFANTSWFQGEQYLPGGGRNRNAHYDPRGVMVDGARRNNGTVNKAAAYGFINGCLRNEAAPLQERYNCGQMHPCRFRYVYARNTTARGIKIHS